MPAWILNSETKTAVMTGVNEAYTELTPFDMARGRNLTIDDIKSKGIFEDIQKYGVDIFIIM